MRESMLDAAYQVILEAGEAVSFNDMLKLIAKRLELEKEELDNKASQLYTSLLRDGRFVTLGENVWDLRKNHKFDAVHIDMNDIYHYDEDTDEEEKEKEKDAEEEDLYDELLEENGYSSSESDLEKEDEEDEVDGFSIKDGSESEEE